MQKTLPKIAFTRNAQIYRLMASPVRLEILNHLREKDYSVDQLCKKLLLRKANISQHLAMLRHAQLVRVQRDGTRAVYSIVDPRIVDPCRILYDLWQHKTLG